MRSEAYAKALVALAVEKFGRLDIAFNNAGTLGEAGPSTDVSEAGWNDAIAINLTGAFLGAKHQIAEMLKHGGGSVIFTSTFVGYSFAFPGVAAYAASKSGLIGLTQALAAEFGPRGVQGQCDPPRRGRDRDVPRDERHCRQTGVHDQSPCAEAGGAARRTRPLGAVPRLRRLGLRDRHRLVGRWRRLYHPELMLLMRRICRNHRNRGPASSRIGNSGLMGWGANYRLLGEEQAAICKLSRLKSGARKTASPFS